MIMLFTIALRNLQRNLRRSVVTIMAIALGGLAILTFAGFMSYIVVGFRTTSAIEPNGHLAVMRTGLFTVGAGNPAAYGIAGYARVIKTIEDDPTLGPMINVITPTINMLGLAANFDADSSRTFFGLGVVPSDREKMRAWDESGITRNRKLEPSGLVDDDPQRGVIGTGLARILGLCQQLNLPNCAAPPQQQPQPPAPAGAPSAPAANDFADLVSRDLGDAPASPDSAMPRIDLLAATSGGSPNVVSLYVAKTQTQGARELDDAFVSMNLALAQQLMYGRAEPQVTSIVIQLHHTADLGAARHRLLALFKEKGLDLEVHDYTELTPMYNQVIGFFGAIFVFIAVVMGVIVLFTVINTMTMSVMERTNEIGTTRALGVRRSGIRRQFLAEGSLLGVIGAVLIVIAVIAALIPANRAARMPVVDSLRHA